MLLQNYALPQDDPPKDDDDICNIYIANLPSGITEEAVCNEFGQYGNIVSIKIMYPRTNEEQSRGTNNAFIAFETREQARSAKDVMDTRPVFGVRLKVGWGKLMSKRSNVASLGQGVVTDKVAHVAKTTAPDMLRIMMEKAPRINVHLPRSRVLKNLIDSVAKMVASEGHVLESLLLGRELHNPWFRFLVPAPPGASSPAAKNQQIEHVYYRWKTYSFANGDSSKFWKTQPFMIYIGGSVWVPPKCEAKLNQEEFLKEKALHRESTVRDLTAIRLGIKGKMGRVGGNSLPEATRQVLLDEVLASGELSSLKREVIAKAMMFCMDHVESAVEIVQLITQQIVSGTGGSPLTQLGRLYVLSDVLHNSGSSSLKSAWAFRAEMELNMPQIMEALCKTSTTREGGAKVNTTVSLKQNVSLH
jgi:U2-associated protein SR140